MITSPKPMTLEQVRDALRESEARNTYVVPTAMLGRWADAIDDYLHAAKPVRRVIERMNSMRWAGFDDVPLKVVVNWATELSVAIGETPFDGVARDSHPPEPERDSVTYEMVERGLVAARDASDARFPRYKVVRAILNAAMAKEHGNG